jgi:hypothetical protein
VSRDWLRWSLLAPISGQEFEEGRINLSHPIFELLAHFSGIAFASEEVQRLLIDTIGRNAELEDVETALESLFSEGRVQRKEIAARRWYTVIRRMIGFVTE